MAGHSLCWNIAILLKCIILFAPHSMPTRQGEDCFTGEETKVKPGRAGRAEPFIVAELSPVTAHYCPLVPICTCPPALQVHSATAFKAKCCSVAKLHLTLCDFIGCSTPGFPILHWLLELAQTHVHRVGDAIQPSHLLLPSSLPALNLSQHQGLFQWVSIRAFTSQGQSTGVNSPSIRKISASADLKPLHELQVDLDGWIHAAPAFCLCWETHVKSGVPRLHQVYSVALSFWRRLACIPSKLRSELPVPRNVTYLE